MTDAINKQTFGIHSKTREGQWWIDGNPRRYSDSFYPLPLSPNPYPRLLTVVPTYSCSSPRSAADPLCSPKKRPSLSHNSIGDLKSLPIDIRLLTFGLRPFNGFRWSSPFLLIHSDHRPSYPQTNDFRLLIFSALSCPMGPLHSLASTVRYSQQAMILTFYY